MELEESVKLPMGVKDIQNCIPHRYPFLLIDRVTKVVPKERIVAVKNVSLSDPILQGHFPDNPVVPGVLIVEGIAQAAAVLGQLSTDDGCSTCYLTEVSSARFRKPVVPGDQMEFDISVIKLRPPFFWFEAKCLVDGEAVAQVKLSAMMK